MDEPAKTEARNYLTAAGFFLFAAYGLICALSGTYQSGTIQLVTGLGLLLIGTLLIVLRKRDMIAILFMMLAFYNISLSFIPGFIGLPIIFCFGGLILLTLLITLTGKDKAKWLLILLPLVMVVRSLVSFLSGIDLSYIILWVNFAIGMYFALACASERLHLPGRKLLTADEETDFKAAGSVLGYVLFAVISGMYVVYYIVGESVMHLEALHTINLVAADYPEGEFLPRSGPGLGIPVQYIPSVLSFPWLQIAPEQSHINRGTTGKPVQGIPRWRCRSIRPQPSGIGVFDETHSGIHKSRTVVLEGDRVD